MLKKNNLIDLDMINLKNKYGIFKLPIMIDPQMEKNSFMAYLGTEIASYIEESDDEIILEGVK